MESRQINKPSLRNAAQANLNALEDKADNINLWIEPTSVQFSCSVMSNSLRPHGLHHTRPPCPSPTPRVYSDSCPLSWWCHATILSSSSPSPPTFSHSQQQGLFKWVSSSYQVAKVLEFQLQHQSLQWTFRTDFLWDGLIGSPCSPRFSNTTVQKHQFFGAQLSL